MKAIIPVAGAGVRLRPHTYTQPKPLILVAGKPIISFIIDQLMEAGIDDFIFILGYLGDKIKAYLDTAYPNLTKHYVYQEERRGLGDAIFCAKDIIHQNEDIIILLGDTIVDLDMVDFINQPNNVLGIQKVNDPRQFGVVEHTDGRVTRVVEKPNIPKSNWAIIGLYKFNDVEVLMNAIEMVRHEITDEDDDIHLTDAIMKMISGGSEINTYEVRNWHDCGKKEVLLETNRVLLKKYSTPSDTQYIPQHSIVIPPVVFGENCEFENSVIGPNVTLGDNVKISHSILKDSILGNYVELSSAVLSQSVIGNDASIKGLSQSLNIGDNNEIDFSQ